MYEQVVRSVIAINNRCIEQLNRGNVIPTLCELHEAMALLKNEVALECPTLPVDTQGNQQQAKMVGVHIQFRMDKLSNRYRSDPCLSTIPSPTTPIVLCNHFLLIETMEQNVVVPSASGPQYQSDIVNKCLQLLCAALLYNMGLLCQHYASTCHLSNQNGSQGTTIALRASAIYEMLIHLCSQGNIWNTDTTTSDANQDHIYFLQIIQMMAYNNFGKIYYKMGDYLIYQQCMIVLQHQLMFLSNFGLNARNRAELNVQEILNELQLNALVANLFPIQTLASAA